MAGTWGPRHSLSVLTCGGGGFQAPAWSRAGGQAALVSGKVVAVIISKKRGKQLFVKPSPHQRPPTCWRMWSFHDEQPRRSVDLCAVRGSAVGQEGRDRQTWSPASLDNWSQGWEAREPLYRKEDRPGLQVRSWPHIYSLFCGLHRIIQLQRHQPN